ncbi:MAG: protoporphyrinogen oxidase HemJ [Bdellovibrionota bacterium]
MLWVKAFHIISVVAWFAGLFYLPRLFVYHATATQDPTGDARFKTMERRLYRAIMWPACIATIALGLWLWLGFGIGRGQVWMHAKLTLGLGLFVYHLFCGRLIHEFAENRNSHSERWYRVFNEVPTLILIATVILVVVKPPFFADS